MCLTLAMTTDAREGRLSPSLNDHFEIRDRQEGSESKKTVIQSISGMQKNARLL